MGSPSHFSGGHSARVGNRRLNIDANLTGVTGASKAFFAFAFARGRAARMLRSYSAPAQEDGTNSSCLSSPWKACSFSPWSCAGPAANLAVIGFTG